MNPSLQPALAEVDLHGGDLDATLSLHSWAYGIQTHKEKSTSRLSLPAYLNNGTTVDPPSPVDTLKITHRALFSTFVGGLNN